MKKKIFSFIIIIVVALMVIILGNHFLISYVPSESMYPNIDSSAFLISNKKSYRDNSPQRGDIIVFKCPLDKSTFYVKRIIGLPTEKVKIEDGKIYINGNEKPLQEEYIYGEWIKDNDNFFFAIPEDCYLVLGDNRNNSTDARYWKDISMDMGLADTESESSQYSFVSGKDIVGKLILEIYPAFKIY